MSVNAIPPAVQKALSTGITTGLTPGELEMYEGLKKLGGKPKPIGDTKEFTTPNSGESTKPMSVVQSSSYAFYASDASVRQKAAELAESCSNDDTGNFKHCQGIVGILAEATPPEVSDTIVMSEAYINAYYPSNEKNKASNAQGKDVIKNLLTKSPDPQIADLAQKAQQGDVKSIRTLETIIASWQPSMVENAKIANEALKSAASAARLAGTNPEEAMEKERQELRDQGVLTKYGDPVFKEGDAWIVPAQLLSEGDRPVIPAPDTSPPKGGSSITSPPKPSEPDPKMEDFNQNGSGDSNDWLIGPIAGAEGKIGIPIPTVGKDGKTSDYNSLLPWVADRATTTEYDGSNSMFITLSENFAKNDTDGNKYVSAEEAQKVIQAKHPDYQYINIDKLKGKGIKIQTIKDIEIGGFNAVRIDENGKKVFYRNNDKNYTGNIPFTDLLEDVPE